MHYNLRNYSAPTYEFYCLSFGAIIVHYGDIKKDLQLQWRCRSNDLLVVNDCLKLQELQELNCKLVGSFGLEVL